MLVARPSHWSDRDYNFAIATIKNAVRLLEDAALLQGYDRHGTAYTLATIAFEEAGKVALRCWSNDEGIRKIGKTWSFHQRKQAAAGCLLLAAVAKDAIDAHPARAGQGTFSRGDAEQESQLREELAHLLRSSKQARLMDHIALQAIERTKQIGFYADDWVLDAGFRPGDMKPDECSAAMQEARTAIGLLKSADHLRLAGAVYRIGPLQEELLKAGKAFAARSGNTNKESR